MRLQRREPMAEDVLPAELDELNQRRDRQNEKLMRLAMGETDAVPCYDYVPLPGTQWAGEPAEAEQWLLDTVRGSKIEYSKLFWRRRRELEELGIAADDAAILREIMPAWRESARSWISACKAVADRRGCLWHANELHQLAGVAQALLEHDVTMAELLK